MSELNITAASEGGFVVWHPAYGDRAGYPREMLFAGSLVDCLEFMRARLAKPKVETVSGPTMSVNA